MKVKNLFVLHRNSFKWWSFVVKMGKRGSEYLIPQVRDINVIPIRDFWRRHEEKQDSVPLSSMKNTNYGVYFASENDAVLMTLGTHHRDDIFEVVYEIGSILRYDGRIFLRESGDEKDARVA